ncbi:hypothetical protein HK101_011950, partial [Irineochytrium annulatum]
MQATGRSYSPTRPAGAGNGKAPDAFESLVSFGPAKPNLSTMTLEQRKLASQAAAPAPNAFDQLAQMQNRPLSPSNPPLRQQQQYNPGQSAFSSLEGVGMFPQASPLSTPPRSMSPGIVGGVINGTRGSPYHNNPSGGSFHSPVPMASSSPHNKIPIASNASAMNANSGGAGGSGTFWDLDYLSKPSVSPQLSTIQPTTTTSDPFEISFLQTTKPSPTQAQPEIDPFSVFGGSSLKPINATTATGASTDYSGQHRRQASPPIATPAPRSAATSPIRSRQPSHDPSSKDFKLAQVMEMGFDLGASEIALEAAGGDVAMAIDLLVKNREADGVERERVARRGRDN